MNKTDKPPSTPSETPKCDLCGDEVEEVVHFEDGDGCLDCCVDCLVYAFEMAGANDGTK